MACHFFSVIAYASLTCPNFKGIKEGLDVNIMIHKGAYETSVTMVDHQIL